LVEHDGLSAGSLDNALPDGDGTSLCARLRERGIPFLIYAGLKPADGPCKDAPFVAKPASHAELRDAIEALIRDGKISN
jgi:DNA-binding response OmpR family regulator